MELSVIIVNYNVKYFLEQAIESVLKSGKDLMMEIIVVDNNSSDGSVEMMQSKYPEITCIVNDHNPGFSIANNQGFALATGKYILFLNPDTVVSENTLPLGIQYLQTHPSAGALGVRMVDGSGQFLPESKRGLPTPLVALFKAIGLHKLFPNSTFFNRYYMGHIGEFETSEIDVLTGAFMLVRKSILDKVGGFDEQFFMYGEDIDLSYRIQQGGFKIIYFPQTTIIHYKGESTKKGSLNYIRHFYRAMIIFAEKHFKTGYPWLLRLILFAGVYLRATFSLGSQFMKKIGWVLMDTITLTGSILLFKHFWAVVYYNNPSYYTDTFYYFNLPVYVITWILTLYFSGVYDQPYKWGRLYKAMLLGLLFNGLIYGLLDNPYRPSRAIMLMGFAGGSVLLTIMRVIWYYYRHKKLPFGENKIIHSAIVANAGEASRIASLSSGIENRKIAIKGLIGPEKDHQMPYLGSKENLEDIIRAHQIDELIFSTDLMPASEIMGIMNKIGPKVKYKVATHGSTGIVGSHDKNKSGEYYAFDIQYNLALPEYRRMKRTFDILIALILFVTGPLLIWLTHEKKYFYRNIWRVLVGRFSWVGYIHKDIQNKGLPQIPEGIYSIVDDDESRNEQTRMTIDREYALKYHIGMDLDRLMKSMFIF